MEAKRMGAQRMEAKRMEVKTPVLTALYGCPRRSHAEASVRLV